MIIVPPPIEELDQTVWMPGRLMQPELLIPGRKPVGPVEIDRDNEFGKYVHFCGIIRNNRLVDIVSGQSWALPNATFEQGGKHGQIATYTDPVAPDVITLPTPWEYPNGANALIISRTNKTTNGGNTACISVDENDGNQNNGFQFGYDYLWYQPLSVWFSNVGTAVGTDLNAAASLNTFTFGGFTIGGGSSDLPSDLYVNGVFANTATINRFHYTLNSSTTLRLGKNTTNRFSFAAIILFSGNNNKFSAGENFKLGTDPYQVLKPANGLPGIAPSMTTNARDDNSHAMLPDARLLAPEMLIPGRKPVGEVEINRSSVQGKHTTLAAYASAKNLAGYEMGTLSGKIAANQIDMTSGGYLDFPNTNLNIADGFLLTMRFKITNSFMWGRVFSTKTLYSGANGFEITRNGSSNTQLRFQLHNNDFLNPSLPTGETTADTLTLTVAYEAANLLLHIKIDGGAITSTTIAALVNGTSGVTMGDNAALNETRSYLLLDYCFFAEGNFTDAHINKAHNDPYGVFLKPKAKAPVIIQPPHQAKAGFHLPDSRLEMPSLLIPGRKPVGDVVVDWEDSRMTDLEFFYLMESKGITKNLAEKPLFGDGIAQNISGVTFGYDQYGSYHETDKVGAEEVYVNNHVDTSMGTEYTLLVVVQRLSTTGDNLLLGGLAWNNGGFGFDFTGSTQMQHAADGAFATWTDTFAANEKHVYMLTRNGDTAHFYRDGVDLGAKTGFSTNVFKWSELFSGASGGDDFNGRTYALAGWTRSMSPGEVQQRSFDYYSGLIPA